MNYETLLSKLSPKDRTNVERHVAACESEPDNAHADLWRRVACDLMTLASHAAKTTGQQTMQFFIADGKYRMQVFALEDQRDGKVVVYASNVLPEALETGVLHPPKRGDEANAYPIHGSSEVLKVDELDGKSLNPAPFYKDMLGWNRKAVRIVLPLTATETQISAAESLLALSASKWASKISA
jgi:hypothetical protein